MDKLKLKVIACDVLNREISYISGCSSCFIDTVFLPQGLHSTPDELRRRLQEEIDKANEGFSYNYYNTDPDYDYIVIGYGLCSNGTAGISTSKVPMVIPKAHDCITLLLGSREKYNTEFKAIPNTYWYSPGWIERGWQPGEMRFKCLYEDYLARYGEDNAEFLMEMEQGWIKDYKRAAYIEWSCIPGQPAFKSFTEKCAEFMKWEYNMVEGSSALLESLLNGRFDEKDFLIVPPGKKTEPSYDETVLKII